MRDGRGSRTIVIGSKVTGTYANRRNVGCYRRATGRMKGILKVSRGNILMNSAKIVKVRVPVSGVGTKVARLTGKGGTSLTDKARTTGTVVAASAGGGRITIAFVTKSARMAVKKVTGNSKVVRPGVYAVLTFVAASTGVSGGTLRTTVDDSIRSACGVVSISKSASAGSATLLLTGKVTKGRGVGRNAPTFSTFGRTLRCMGRALTGTVTKSKRNTATLFRMGIIKTRAGRRTGILTGSIMYSGLAGTTVTKRSTG